MEDVRFETWKGAARVALDIDPREGAILVLPNGRRIELSWRASDQTASLSSDGSLVIEPAATNVVRLSVKP